MRWAIVFVAVAVLVCLSDAQQTSETVAFRGEVQSIEHIAPQAADGLGMVRVRFVVSEPLRGVRRGQTITIQEWDGLWRRQERYRVGQFLQISLSGASGTGLTSGTTGDPKKPRMRAPSEEGNARPRGAAPGVRGPVER